MLTVPNRAFPPPRPSQLPTRYALSLLRRIQPLSLLRPKLSIRSPFLIPSLSTLHTPYPSPLHVAAIGIVKLRVLSRRFLLDKTAPLRPRTALLVALTRIYHRQDAPLPAVSQFLLLPKATTHEDKRCRSLHTRCLPPSSNDPAALCLARRLVGLPGI